MVAPIVLNRQGRAVLQGLQRVVHQRLAALQASRPDAATDIQITRAHDVLACIGAALTPDDVPQPAASHLLPAQAPQPSPPKASK